MVSLRNWLFFTRPRLFVATPIMRACASQNAHRSHDISFHVLQIPAPIIPAALARLTCPGGPLLHSNTNQRYSPQIYRQAYKQIIYVFYAWRDTKLTAPVPQDRFVTLTRPISEQAFKCAHLSIAHDSGFIYCLSHRNSWRYELTSFTV